MRPIKKPNCPTINGVPKTVSDYKYWKLDLETAIGMFCTYCGMRLNNSPQVEHVVPQNPMTGNPAGNPLAWENVVFSCGPCNGASGKTNKNYNKHEHYMPEVHNTLLPFQYPLSSINGHVTVEIAEGLSPSQKVKAIETITVFNFQNIDNRENKVDYRSSERWQVKQTVDATYEMYLMAKGSGVYDVVQVASIVATIAAGAGFFQLWVEAFINEPEVLKKLIQKEFYPGTHQDSFDNITGRPCNRNITNLSDPF